MYAICVYVYVYALKILFYTYIYIYTKNNITRLGKISFIKNYTQLIFKLATYGCIMLITVLYKIQGHGLDR